MKRFLLLTIVFANILSMVNIPKVTNNMNNANVSKSLSSTVLETQKVISTANSAEKVYISYHVGYTLLKSGKLKKFSDQKRIISEKIPAENNCIYHFKNLSAKYGNCFYVVYNSNNEVINYLGTNEETTGEVIEDINIIMPEGASYFRLACDLNINDKMFEMTKSYNKSARKTSEPAVISFIDDDCRSEVYTVLYPLIKKLNLPYTLACPPDNLDDKDGKYMTTEQLKEVYANGVNVVSHHRKEYGMTEFDTIEDYREDTVACLEKLKNMGIKVSGVAYPNGLIKDEYMPVVKEFFKFGFTTDRAINTLPYESSYIHRCEVFPQSEIYNIDDAKALVDSVSENGGWLVFMTHCWFKTFSPDDLEELVNYIRSKNIEIANVTEVSEKYANPIDIGIAKKPFNDMAEDFFIVDCMGRAYTNNIKMNNIETNNIAITEKSAIKWNEISIPYNLGVTLLPSGKVLVHYNKEEQMSKEELISQKKRNVSDKIYVEPNRKYKLANMSAKYGKCFYVIYDADNKVISYQGTSDSSTGETLDEIIITMPSNASYFRLACDLNVNSKMFKVYCANIEDKTIIFDPNEGIYTTGSIHSGYTLLKSGKLKEFVDKNRIISEKIYVENNKIYYFENLSAKYGNCFCVIYDSDNKVIDYLGTDESSTGDTIEKIKVIMPENASYFRLACDLNVNDKMFKAYCTIDE